MIPCVIFLNELSYTVDEGTVPAEIIPVILSTLYALKAAKEIRQDLVLAGDPPISKIPIGNGSHSLSSLLRGDYREEWRFLRSLEQASPEDIEWDIEIPDQVELVTYEGREAVGILWANRWHSLVLSLGFLPHWNGNQITAQLSILDGLTNITNEETITIRNVATPQHVNDHNLFITNLGRDESASSVIYQCDDFIVRMYFNDHLPAHFHIFLPSDTTRTAATVRIETLDVLSGQLSGSIHRLVRAWAVDRRAQLLDNWSRCRNGQHPILLN